MSADPTRGPNDPKAPSTPQPSPPRVRVAWWVVASVVALLAINYWAASRATQAHPRVRIPYSPVFLQQVKAGNVSSIRSKGTAIQGTFTHSERYGKSKPTKLFKTEVPAFADTNALSRLLQSKGVVINAEPLDTGGPWWQNLLLGFGPTLLLIGLLVWISRRAGSMQNVLGSFGRARARRYEPSGEPVTFADVAGIDEAKEELTEIVDFLRHPD
ncbi:MAG: cell division protein FtsH, partial [Actinobacteria bacterium]